MKIKRIYVDKFILSILLIINSCFLYAESEFEITGAEIIQDKELRKTVFDYYNAEENCDWKTTYELRTDSFKKLFLYKDYVTEYRRQTKNWKLLGLEILDYRIGNKEDVYIKIRFKEKLSADEAKKIGYPIMENNYALPTSSEFTHWKKENGVWKVLNSGDRFHIYINME